MDLVFEERPSLIRAISIPSGRERRYPHQESLRHSVKANLERGMQRAAQHGGAMGIDFK